MFKHGVQLDLEPLAFALGDDDPRPQIFEFFAHRALGIQAVDEGSPLRRETGHPTGRQQERAGPEPFSYGIEIFVGVANRVARPRATCGAPTPRRLHISTARARNTDEAVGPRAISKRTPRVRTTDDGTAYADNAVRPRTSERKQIEPIGLDGNPIRNERFEGRRLTDLVGGE